MWLANHVPRTTHIEIMAELPLLMHHRIATHWGLGASTVDIKKPCRVAGAQCSGYMLAANWCSAVHVAYTRAVRFVAVHDRSVFQTRCELQWESSSWQASTLAPRA